MYGVLKRYVCDAATAEDLLHDGFVTLYTRMSDYRGEGPFEGWCRRIFVNTAMSHLRRRSPLKDAEDVETPRLHGSVPPTAIDRLSLEELKACVDTLPDGYRTVFNLHAVEEYGYDEIARMLGISEATARSQYLRARQRLGEVIVRRLRHDRETEGHGTTIGSDRFPVPGRTGERRRASANACIAPGATAWPPPCWPGCW